jgi:hypothetical protein
MQRIEVKTRAAQRVRAKPAVYKTPLQRKYKTISNFLLTSGKQCVTIPLQSQ